MGGRDCTYHFYYDDQQLIETRAYTNSVIKQYVWGTQYVDELLQIGVNTNPSSDNTCDVSYRVLQDANYNVTGLIDSEGDFVERYEYTPYGQRTVYKRASTSQTKPMCPILDSQRVTADSTTQPYGLCEFGFQGLMHEEEVGIINNRARYVHPFFGTFMSWDPQGYVDGPNLYEHLKSNPLINFDPTGEGIEVLWEYPWGAAKATARAAVRGDQFGGQVWTYVVTCDWVDPTTASGLCIWGQTLPGLGQGVLNTANGVQDVGIDIINVGPGAYNCTAGWWLPNCPYVPSPDWSRNRITYESDSAHNWSKGLSGGGVATVATLGIATTVQVPKYAVPVLKALGAVLVARNTYRSGEMIGYGTVDIENGNYWTGGGEILFGSTMAGLNIYSGVQIGRSFLPTSKPIVVPGNSRQTGAPFRPGKMGLQEGVDPSTLRTGNQQTIDPRALERAAEDVLGPKPAPIQVTKDGVIIDGHHRAYVASKLGITVSVEVVPGRILTPGVPPGELPVRH